MVIKTMIDKIKNIINAKQTLRNSLVVKEILNNYNTDINKPILAIVDKEDPILFILSLLSGGKNTMVYLFCTDVDVLSVNKKYLYETYYKIHILNDDLSIIGNIDRLNNVDEYSLIYSNLDKVKVNNILYKILRFIKEDTLILLNNYIETNELNTIINNKVIKEYERDKFVLVK